MFSTKDGFLTTFAGLSQNGMEASSQETLGDDADPFSDHKTLSSRFILLIPYSSVVSGFRISVFPEARFDSAAQITPQEDPC